MKNVGHYQKNFDLDLEFGQRGENYVLDLLKGANKVEVKTDRFAHYTQRLSVEYKYNGNPSGISTTEADYWAFVIPQTGAIIFVPTDKLKEMCRLCHKMNHKTDGGFNNSSWLIHVPLWMIAQYQKL